jgi:hypothetical protein
MSIVSRSLRQHLGVLVVHHGDGTVEHYHNGRLHDPIPGVPAVRHANGTARHYQHGKLQDPAPGVPAVQWSNGYVCHYQGDKIQDPAPGVPARRRADGTVFHYQNGLLHDPAPGVPAVRYASGTTGHYVYGAWCPSAYAASLCVCLATSADGEYVLVRDWWGRYHAGCRNFSREEALAHWTPNHRPEFHAAILADTKQVP